MSISGGKRKLIQWLVGVCLDHKTWLWLRRRHRGLIAKRLVNGYKIIGILEVNDYEHNAFF